MDHQPNSITGSTFALETPHVNKTADSIWLKVGKLFPDTTGFMITRIRSLLPIIIRSIV
jgi:hypothetical protein